MNPSDDNIGREAFSSLASLLSFRLSVASIVAPVPAVSVELPVRPKRLGDVRRRMPRGHS